MRNWPTWLWRQSLMLCHLKMEESRGIIQSKDRRPWPSSGWQARRNTGQHLLPPLSIQGPRGLGRDLPARGRAVGFIESAARVLLLPRSTLSDTPRSRVWSGYPTMQPGDIKWTVTCIVFIIQSKIFANFSCDFFELHVSWRCVVEYQEYLRFYDVSFSWVSSL